MVGGCKLMDDNVCGENISYCIRIFEEYDQDHRHTKEKVKEQTQLLYKNGDQKKIGPNGEAFFDILCDSLYLSCILVIFSSTLFFY